MATACHRAARRARLRPGIAAALAPSSVEDLAALGGLKLAELALLADALHVVPRVTARWALELAETEGLLGVLRAWPARRPITAAELRLRGAEQLGWLADPPVSAPATAGLLAYLAELQVLARAEGGYAWLGEPRDVALAPGEEVHARELFGGTLAFYRACLDALPGLLRGAGPRIGWGPEHASLWEGVLGSPEQILLRRLGLKALKAPVPDVLDLACGAGHGTACIVEELPESRITAIDFTDANYARVEERARQSAAAVGRPLELTMAKPWPGWGEALPFPDASFDAVFLPMNDGFIPPHRRAEVCGEIRRVLRPGGQLCMVTAPLPDASWRPRAWELRAHTWFHHTVEFAVQGFHGLATAEEHAEALRKAGFDAGRPRLAGLVWVARAG